MRVRIIRSRACTCSVPARTAPAAASFSFSSFSSLVQPWPPPTGLLACTCLSRRLQFAATGQRVYVCVCVCVWVYVSMGPRAQGERSEERHCTWLT